MSTRMLALLAGIGAAAFWGGLYPAIKVIMEVLPPFVLLAVRLLLALLMLWPFVEHRGGVHWTRRTWMEVLGVGALGFGFALGVQFVGTHLSTASNGALVTTATPAFVALFGALVLHEHLNRGQAAALLASTVGVLLIIDPHQARLSAMFWGNLALLLAALGWALYSVLVRWLTRRLDTLAVSWGAMLGGLPVVLPLAAWQSGQIHWEGLSWGVVAGVAYVAVFATALAMFLWNYAFAYLESGTAALTFFAQPVVGVLVGVLWLHETLTWSTGVGGLLVAAGIYLAATSRSHPALEGETNACA